MYTIITEKINDFDIVRGFGEAVINPIETIRQGEIIYFEPKIGEIIEDDITELEEKLNSLSNNEVLTLEGEIIPDYSTEILWELSGGEWNKINGLPIGLMPKVNQYLEQSLIPEQLAEIKEQEEARQISEMGPADREKYLLYTEIIPEIDDIFNDVYRTNGKNYDGVMLQRFFELFSESGEIAYRNEFHNLSDFNPVSCINFKYSDAVLPASNDKGFIYVDDISKDAEIIYDTRMPLNKFIIGGLNIFTECGYNLMTDIQISVIKGLEETPIIPIGKRPYTVFGYADLSGNENVKIKLKVIAGNATKRAALLDIRVAG